MANEANITPVVHSENGNGVFPVDIAVAVLAVDLEGTHTLKCAELGHSYRSVRGW